MKKIFRWLRRVATPKIKKLKKGDIVIDYDGITCLEYEIFRVDFALGIAFGRGVWEGQTYEKLFSILYTNPRHIFDFPYEPNNPDPPRRFLLNRK